MELHQRPQVRHSETHCSIALSLTCCWSFGTAAPQLLSRVTVDELPRLTVIFGDNKYHNHSLNAWLTKYRPQWTIEVQSPPAASQSSED